jgi:two-component system cell cycle response regulator DivK
MNNPHALIIDDDNNNLEVLAGLLEAQGLTSTAIKDPTKVAAVLQALTRIDVVFCDLEMPRMNGYQLLAMLREQLYPSTLIIACTVHISEIDVTRKIGFDGFLGKPLDAERFPNQIRSILSGRSVWELP